MPDRNEDSSTLVGRPSSEGVTRPQWSIVIPCYRSGDWIPELLGRIHAALGQRHGLGEIILVDDASPDRTTWPAIEKAAAEHPWVRGIGLQFNVGQYRALMAGLAESRGQWVVTMDDDLQTPPEELQKLFQAATEYPEMDAIIGRYAVKRHSRLRNLGTRLVARVHAVVYDSPPGLETTSFRIMNRLLVDALCADRSTDPVFPSIILRNTRRILNVEVEHAPRTRGQSGYSLSRMVDIVLTQVFNASTMPLRFVSLLGLTVSIAALAFGAYSFVAWLRGLILEPGFTTLVLLISLLGGLILLSVGVIGEYLIRVVTESGGAPRYIVRARAGESRREDER